MTKWGVLSGSNQAASRINQWTSSLMGDVGYDRMILPAIFLMIIGATRKWNGTN